MDDEEESPDGKDAVDADTDEMEADEAASEPTKNGSTPNFLSPLLQPLLHLIQPTKLSFSPSQAEGGGPSPHPPSTSVLGAIHVCALECLNNLFLALAANSGSPAAEAARADTGAGQRVWAELWRALAAVGTDTTGPGQERRREVWDMAAGVLWGIGGVWRGALAPDEQQVALLVQLCDTSTDEAVRVKCVGALESLALYPASVDANRVSWAMSLISLNYFSLTWPGVGHRRLPLLSCPIFVGSGTAPGRRSGNPGTRLVDRHLLGRNQAL
jgi:hypothetical protein